MFIIDPAVFFNKKWKTVFFVASSVLYQIAKIFFFDLKIFPQVILWKANSLPNDGGQKYIGNFNISKTANRKNPQKFIRIAYELLMRTQKELFLYLHLPPRYRPLDYGGKSGFSWTKIHIFLEGWNKNLIRGLLDSWIEIWIFDHENPDFPL